MTPPIRVISLARSLDRRQAFADANGHIDFTFSDAIDGAAILHEVGHAPELFEPGLPYSAGAYGCAMSHLNLWQEAVDSDRPVTVVEDDAVLRHDFEAQSAALLAGLAPDWDIVVWAWNFDSILALNIMPGVSPAVMLFDQAQLRTSLPDFQAMPGTPAALRLDKCFGTPAYTISPAGARKYMLQCFPLKRFSVYFPVLNRELPNNGIDIAMNRIYGQTNAYCSLPPLAATPNEHASSLIQQRR
jgi:GR25 family glycosyltransferase involved in LPS biosynthesis